MEPEAKYTLVGGCGAGAAGADRRRRRMAGVGKRGNDVQRYKIYFTRQSLEGLQVRSDVRHAGHPGRRGHRLLASRSSARARSRSSIGVDPATPVRESTRAVVDRNLITGMATIRLQNLNEDSPPISRRRPASAIR